MTSRARREAAGAAGERRLRGGAGSAADEPVRRQVRPPARGVLLRSVALQGVLLLGALLLVAGGCAGAPPTTPGATTLAYLTETPNDNPGTLFVHDLRADTRQTMGDGRVRGVRKFRWSPDGERLAFETEGGGTVGGGETVGIATAEGAVTWRSHDPEDQPDDRAADSTPRWSPDGELLAFTRSRVVRDKSARPTGSRVHVVAADGTGERAVTKPPEGVEDRDPLVWSPHGGRLAFLRVSRRGDDPHARTMAVYTVPVDGGPATRLTDNYKEVSSLTWSPDGSRLAFAADGAVHLVAPDGTHHRRITVEGTALEDLSWSPSGQHLVGSANSQLFVIPASGDGQPRPVTPPPDGVWDYAWSPNGEELAVSAEHAGNSRGLYRVDVATGEATLVAQPRERVSEPAWSSDGALLAFKATEEGAGLLGLGTDSDVFVVRADGSELHQLTDDSTSFKPAFRP